MPLSLNIMVKSSADQQLDDHDATKFTVDPSSEQNTTLSSIPPGEVDFYPTYFALNPIKPVLDASHGQVSFDKTDTYDGLPMSDGVELVAGYCASCHSLRIVMQQGLTEDRWDALLDWMVAKQGMAEPHPEDRLAIVSYLAREFPSNR